MLVTYVVRLISVFRGSSVVLTFCLQFPGALFKGDAGLCGGLCYEVMFISFT